MNNLNELKERAYKNACSHGWHDEELSDEHFLMLIITEIAEAVNADRKDRHAFRKMFEGNAYTPQPHPEKHWAFCFGAFIKDTVEDELADTVIRCLDLAGLKEWHFPTLECMNATSWKEKAFKVPFSQFAYRLCQELTDECGLPDVRVFNVIGQIFVYCRFNCIDIEWFIEQKMRYNELRSYKHGNKRY